MGYRRKHFSASRLLRFGCYGNVLLSHEVTPEVSSALEGLTAVFGMGTGVPLRYCHRNTIKVCKKLQILIDNYTMKKILSSPRPISTSKLNSSRCLHIWPINLLVSKGPYQINSVGYLILRWASRLDAFSAYPFRT